MEDPEGVLSFDFEGGLDTTLAPSNPAASTPLIHSSAVSSAVGSLSSEPNASNLSGRRSFRQTVCRHWLRSLCMKGDACGFLHQYDKSRMPVCRFFRMYGECREQDCVYKHTNEDVKECNMYKMGFCPNGPDCRYRHVKLPGPPPPVEEVLQKIQQMSSFNYGGTNRLYQNRISGLPQHSEKSQFPQNSYAVNQNVATKPLATEPTNTRDVQQSQNHVNQPQIQSLSNGHPNQANKIVSSLPQGVSRYFIVKSCNRENLELSVQQGVWATQRSNEAKLNEAFDSTDNVILIFSINRTRHFQGCAKMTSKIGGFVGGGNWKLAHGAAHYGRNFSLKWLKLCELSFHITRHLRNPYNENLPVKISRDCQELEPSVGEQLASLLYLEADSELMAISVAAELKREDEKAKGVQPDNGGENPDIVLFEDEEEEEEEDESDEDDEGYSQAITGQSRGRGKGLPWQPQMQILRGPRPIPGMRGFPPVMMSPDGFPYSGSIIPDGFPIPDLFGPRGFPPYGMRFPGDFTAPPPNVMFHGLPSQPGGMFPGGGFGMMMGPGRGPFICRPNRPNLPSMFSPLPHNSNRVANKDDTYNEQRVKEEKGQFDLGNRVGNEESESEDEAPRRSRHGEGKKKRRDSEGDINGAD